MALAVDPTKFLLHAYIYLRTDSSGVFFLVRVGNQGAVGSVYRIQESFFVLARAEDRVLYLTIPLFLRKSLSPVSLRLLSRSEPNIQYSPSSDSVIYLLCSKTNLGLLALLVLGDMSELYTYIYICMHMYIPSEASGQAGMQAGRLAGWEVARHLLCPCGRTAEEEKITVFPNPITSRLFTDCDCLFANHFTKLEKAPKQYTERPKHGTLRKQFPSLHSWYGELNRIDTKPNEALTPIHSLSTIN